MPNPRDKRGSEAEAKIDKQNERIGLPYRPFLFTLDQIAALTSMTETQLRDRFVFFDGRSHGAMSRHFMLARNIAPPNERPEWRIAERELLRWMKHKGFKHYEGTVATH